MNIKEFYEKIIEHRVEMTTYYKLVIITAIKEKKLSELLQTLKPLEKVVQQLKEEGVITYLNKRWMLSTIKYEQSNYFSILDKIENAMPFSQFANKFFMQWRGKMGISKGKRYPLLDKKAAEKALFEFAQEESEIPLTVILKANEEFLETLKRDSSGNLEYAPKCSTFIKGNNSSGYLIEYCYNIIERRKEQSTINKVNTGADGRFWQDI